MRYYVYERIRRWIHVASFDTPGDAEWFCRHPPPSRADRPLRIVEMWPRPRVLNIYVAGQPSRDEHPQESSSP